MTSLAQSHFSVLDVLRDPQMFGSYFQPAGTWAVWASFLASLFALTPTAEDLARFQKFTGRTTWPTAPAREAWLACGRRAGKSRIAALVAVFLACFGSWQHLLAPGEVGTIAIVAADRKQARTILRYVRGLLEHEMLEDLVESENEESVRLRNRIQIEVHTASYRSVRGYTLVAALCDEIALWRNEESATPDSEILGALRPGLATTRGLLLCLSNPYARKGELYKASQKHFGRDGDPVLYWTADSASMNPSLDAELIAAEFEDDPARAWSEYGRAGEIRFRDDVVSFVPSALVDVATDKGVLAREPISGVAYTAFVDPASGSGQDSFVLAIAHKDTKTGQAILDLIDERKPPFSPSQVVKEFAAILRSYRLVRVVGDRYGAGIMTEMFKTAGIRLEHSEDSRSDIYLNMLPLLTAGRVRLLNEPRLKSQLIGLERRTNRAGRDSVDAGRGGHEDVANAAAGALVLAAAKRRDSGVTI